MPQVSPLFWSLIIILLTYSLMTNKEILPKMNFKKTEKAMTKNKENSMKW